MKRVRLRVESLDGRILPSASSGSFHFGDPGKLVLGSKPAGAGDGIQVLGGSTGGTNLKECTGMDIEPFGGSKPSTGGSTVKLGTETGVELFGGSKTVASGGSN